MANPIVIKDSNQVEYRLATSAGGDGSLAVWHMAASLDSNGIANATSPTRPLPVINVSGTSAIDGSGSIAAGGQAQLLFGGTIPVNGYLIANNSAGLLYHCDVATASNGGASLPIEAGKIFRTPTGYKPGGAVSIWGGTISQAFAARRW